MLNNARADHALLERIHPTGSVPPFDPASVPIVPEGKEYLESYYFASHPEMELLKSGLVMKQVYCLATSPHQNYFTKFFSLYMQAYYDSIFALAVDPRI